MEPWYLSACSQEPVTYPCPDLGDSSPCNAILFKIDFNIIPLSTPRSFKWSLCFKFSDEFWYIKYTTDELLEHRMF
jgi:hypothetical protein